MAEKASQRARVRLSLDVSPELNALLEDLADKTDSTKSDVLRRAIALMDVAVNAKEEGQKVYVTSDLSDVLNSTFSDRAYLRDPSSDKEDGPLHLHRFPIKEIVGF